MHVLWLRSKNLRLLSFFNIEKPHRYTVLQAVMPYLHINFFQSSRSRNIGFQRVTLTISHTNTYTYLEEKKDRRPRWHFFLLPKNAVNLDFSTLELKGCRKRYAFFYCYAYWRLRKFKTLRRCLKNAAVHIASILPWFSVNELLYIFVILYKKRRCLFKKYEKKTQEVNAVTLVMFVFWLYPEPWNLHKQ